MLKDLKQARELSKRYDVPLSDILMLSFNLVGVRLNNCPLTRIRFKMKVKNSPHFFYFGVPVNQCDSPFTIKSFDLNSKQHKVLFNGKPIAIIKGIENDTCDSTYFRRNKTTLTLNSNSRSSCNGCKFCGTYHQDPEDRHNLLTEERLKAHLDNVLKENNLLDFSQLYRVTICTGCFNNENKVINHVLMVRKVLKPYGFYKTLRYIGAEVVSDKSLDLLRKNASPFALSFTVECFSRRKKMMKPTKSRLNLDQVRNVLQASQKRGFHSNILFVLGMDPLEVVIDEFKKFAPLMTKFPVINVFQLYKKSDDKLLCPGAKSIEYYLKARKAIEKIFMHTSLRPSPWENYRPLWYLTFGGEKINDIKI